MNRTTWARALAAAFGVVLLAGSTPAFAQSDSCATRFPIVLGNGLFNGAPDPIVIETLRACGATVFQTSVSPTEDSITRGMELLEQVREIIAMTGAEKVHLIGHSQVSFGMSIVMDMVPERVGSITTLAGLRGPGPGAPGSAVADFGLQIGPAVARGLLAGQVDSFGGQEGTDAGFARALQTLSSAGATEFNRMFPAGVPTEECGEGEPMVNGVLLQSFGGTTIRTNPDDQSDVALQLGATPFGATLNDGLVAQCASHFGRVRADDLEANHLDFIARVDNLTSPNFDAPGLFRMIATELAQMGL